MKPCHVALEVSGPTAMFTRPDTGSSPVSYPAPTFSAVKGIFEAVLYLKTALVVPWKVEICAPVKYHHYTTNNTGPFKKPGKDGALQIPATVLMDVTYRLYARVFHDQSAGTAPCTNSAHAYQEMFERRLERGQCYRTPCLGWKEFVAEYWGPLRDGTGPCAEVSMNMPSFFKAFDYGMAGQRGSWHPVYLNNVPIRQGVLIYE